MNLHRLVKQAITGVRVIESYGITEVGRDWFQPPVDEIPSEVLAAQRELVALGMNLAHALGPCQWSDAGQVFLSFSNSLRSNAAQVNALVVAAAESNRAKLAAAKADDRHLFVWMNPSHGNAEAAASLGRLQGGPHDMPPEIDCVWLATRGVPGFGAVRVGNVGVLRLWTARGAGDWQQMPLRRLVGQ